MEPDIHSSNEYSGGNSTRHSHHPSKPQNLSKLQSRVRSRGLRGEVMAILRETLREWSEDRGSQLGAALAYYTVFSLAPVLVIVIAVAGFVFGRDAVEGQIVEQLGGLLGPQGAAMVEHLLKNAANPRTGIIATLLGLGTLILGATAVFLQLQSALDTIWDVRRVSKSRIMRLLKDRWLSFAMVLGIGFLLLVSLIVSSILAALSDSLAQYLPARVPVLYALSFITSFGFITVLFAMIFKFLPGVEIEWRDVWIGAASTALLFSIGKVVIGMYLGNASVASSFGAAGSVIVILIWTYYSAQILLFGAEFSQVYARRRGRVFATKPGYAAVPDHTEA